MNRVLNFSAGPSMLPLEVLEEAQRDLVDYKGCGSSVMEMSHRSKYFAPIIADAEASLRRIMNISDDYHVLFLQGGASLQFSMIPMNLAKRGEKAAYVVTGQFAGKALDEGARWCDAVCLANGKENGFTAIPRINAADVPQDARFLHITVNNTIYGTMWSELPETGSVPLVGDLSSVALGREYDINRFGLAYMGAQKNMGIAGLTVVIIRKELVTGELDEVVPSMLRYDLMAKNGSMYNTPPAFAIYMAGLMFNWVEAQGGVAEMERRNKEKAALLYSVLDESSMFAPRAEKDSRSITNVTFTLPTPELTADFVRMAEGRGMINVKGHRLTGGCRASIYNGKYETESSGGITYDTIRDYAEQGVDFISVGALTHSVKGLDMSFKACE